MWYHVVGTGISISVVSCIGLGDIEIQYYDDCQQRHCNYWWYCIVLCNLGLVSSTCVLWVTTLKNFKGFLCMFTLCAQFYGAKLQYVAIYCDTLCKWYYWHVKSLQYQLLHASVLQYWWCIEILPALIV